MDNYIFFVCITCACIREERYLRVKKMLEEPCSKDRYGALREAPLGPPGTALHHSGLLKYFLLSKAPIEHLEPWGITSCRPRCNRVLLSHSLLCRLDLTHYPILETSEVLRHGLWCQHRVNRRRPFPGHRLKWRDNGPHLLAVFLVPPIHLM